jgi:agmatine/peptidylarginine deiminase
VDTTQTPAAQGFTMPGEFEKHAGCWMGWPYDKYLWREDALPAKKQYAAVAKVGRGAARGFFWGVGQGGQLGLIDEHCQDL